MVRLTVGLAREMLEIAGIDQRDPEQTLRDGTAMDRFRALIAAQDGDLSVPLPVGKYSETVTAARSGTMGGIDAMAVGLAGLRAQDATGELTRRVKSKVQAVYPQLARKMNLAGTVKVQVVVAPNGDVKEAKVVGGHPVLANAAMDAVRKWRFEPAAGESTGIVDFKFQPQH